MSLYHKSCYFFLSALAIMVIASCSDYNKVLKSTDIDLKYTKAVEYYEHGECFKALPLLEELIGLTRGTQRAEDVYYYYAKTHFCVKDYYLANYYFKSFCKTFANSTRAEECQFLAAECSYTLSPLYSLDQTDTYNAINEYQLFLDKYPNSNLRDSANHQVERLSGKLEIKAFEVAVLYAKNQRYKAAVSALRQFLADYPQSKYREEVMYQMVRCSYMYAHGSIDTKKLERYRAANETYLTFAAAFPESDKLRDAEDYYRKSNKQIEKLTSTTTVP
jgi:outer membrane protein assembly factor BamD